MDLTQLSIADLYAMKSEAKEKEAYFRILKVATPEAATEQTKWSTILYHADKELVARLTNLK